MDDLYVKLITVSLDFAKALVWPTLLVWFVFQFRTNITELFHRLASVRFGKNVVVFQKVERLEAELQKTNLVVGGLSENPNDPKAIQGAKNLLRPDGASVIAWARDHGAENAWDMGPKNWERCLYDLRLPGGVEHALIMENGKLKYQ